MNSNRTIVDLGKVAYANYFYTTKDNSHRRNTRPRYPTANNQDVSDKSWFAPEVQLLNGETWPRETMLARAKRRGLLDTWQPRLVLQLCNSHSLTYTGAKATSIWKEWNRRQFKKKKG